MSQTQEPHLSTEHPHRPPTDEIPPVSEEDFMDFISSSAIGFDMSTLLENSIPPKENSQPSTVPSHMDNQRPTEISDDEFMRLVTSGRLDAEFGNLLLEIPPEIGFTRQPEISNGLFNSAQALSSTTHSTPAMLTAAKAIAPHILPGFSPLSNFSSPLSYMSAGTPASFLTARSNFNSPVFIDQAMSSDGRRMVPIQELHLEEPSLPAQPGPLAKISKDYRSHLEKRGLLTAPEVEINWSGKGQHVEFSSTEEVPLQVLSHLGSSISATVDKVRCMRIALARKMMRCTRNWKVVDALREVEHLHRLRHFHTVQLVGSYLQGRTFSILLYPAADCHLGTFLEETGDMITPGNYELQRRIFLASTLSCLTSAVAFIHSNTTRHMDIKPANILIRKVEDSYSEHHWRVYLADFGLSRSFAAQDHSQTDGPTARTPKYCAPEVYDWKSHGRSADVFSLGCVFLEILSVLYGNSPCDFADFRRGENGCDESFRGNLNRVSEWIDMIINSPIGPQETLSQPLVWGNKGIYPVLPSGLLDIVRQMLQHDPNERPTALFIQDFFELDEDYGNVFAKSRCCLFGPEPYVAS